jgi:hypothetical protein
MAIGQPTVFTVLTILRKFLVFSSKIEKYLNTWALVIVFFFFWQYWGLNSGPLPCATPLALFLDVFFLR